MKYKIIILLFFTGCFTSCIKDVLNRKPLNLISDSDVWQSPKLIDLYLVPLYDNIPFGHNRLNTFIYESNLTDESSQPYAGVTIVSGYGNHALAQNTVAYTWIRRANYFLEMIPNSANVLTAAEITALSAECRFLRAYYYFDLVKKYGGMPLVTTAQQFNNNLEELLVARNKEEEVYDFLLSELTEIAGQLPAGRDAANAYRATKWTALALKARAAVYAGAIAKFGSVQLNGIVGLPASKSDAYYKEAYNAAKEIRDNGPFSLYTKLYDPAGGTGNPEANFQQIFLDKNNSEIIFQKAYNYPDKFHAYDTYNLPESYKPGCCGNAQTPTLEMAESFEYKDGSPGNFVVDGKEFSSPDELFANKDPRFAATIFRSGSPYIGREIRIWRGIYDQNNNLHDVLNTPFPPDPARLQVGPDGPYTLGEITKTGLLLKKYLNATTVVPEVTSSQNYIDFRYAEILLTLAEAAFETGTDLPGALDAINQIRKRAGIRELTPTELTQERIRNERKVELAFEDKRFWDIRRYRIGTTLFRNTNMHGLWPYLKYNGNSYKYIFKVVSGAPIDNGLSRVFEERDYYSNLATYISTNKNIVNNPAW